jgi:hypothetical protein
MSNITQLRYGTAALIAENPTVREDRPAVKNCPGKCRKPSKSGMEEESNDAVGIFESLIEEANGERAHLSELGGGKEVGVRPPHFGGGGWSYAKDYK